MINVLADAARFFLKKPMPASVKPKSASDIGAAELTFEALSDALMLAKLWMLAMSLTKFFEIVVLLGGSCKSQPMETTWPLT